MPLGHHRRDMWFSTLEQKKTVEALSSHHLLQPTSASWPKKQFDGRRRFMAGAFQKRMQPTLWQSGLWPNFQGHWAWRNFIQNCMTICLNLQLIPIIWCVSWNVWLGAMWRSGCTMRRSKLLQRSVDLTSASNWQSWLFSTTSEVPDDALIPRVMRTFRKSNYLSRTVGPCHLICTWL